MSLDLKRPVLVLVVLLISPWAVTQFACFRESTPATVAPATTAQPQGDRLGPLPTIDVTINGRRFTLEVANDSKEREQGLMYRTSLPADRGMIFVFDDEHWLSFWMKNTEIPLDIIYLNQERKVVSIHQMKPHDLTSTFAAAPSKYAIELNVNTANQLGLRLGQVIELPTDLKAE